MGSTVSAQDDDGKATIRRGEDPVLDTPDLDVKATTALLRHANSHMHGDLAAGHKRLSTATWEFHTNQIIHLDDRARRLREQGQTTEYILLTCRTTRGRVAGWLKTQCCACEGV
jgi:hypothetical protein